MSRKEGVAVCSLLHSPIPILLQRGWGTLTVQEAIGEGGGNCENSFLSISAPGSLCWIKDPSDSGGTQMDTTSTPPLSQDKAERHCSFLTIKVKQFTSDSKIDMILRLPLKYIIQMLFGRDENIAYIRKRKPLLPRCTKQVPLLTLKDYMYNKLPVLLPQDACYMDLK